MDRVVTVIATSLVFAILGLVAGHFCADAYSGVVSIDAAGRSPSTELLVSCYLVAPAIGAGIGFVAAVCTFWLFGPSRSPYGTSPKSN